MRKFAILLLIFASVIILALSACGTGDADNNYTPEPTPEITTPTPEPTPLLQGRDIVGTWACMEAGARLYNFYADGEGTRGFNPVQEPFQWRTEGDNHLIITTSAEEESWTYILSGNMLTIVNRQNPGMEYSYLRVPEGTVAESRPIRGGWDENVYTSEYLGFSFTLPQGWRAHSEADIAAVIGMAEGTLGGQGTYIPANVDIFVDMAANNPATGANIQISFDKLDSPMTEQEYIALSSESIEFYGGSVTGASGTVRIGNYDWHYFSSELDFGVMIYARQFVNIRDGFVRSIIIGYIEGSETAEDILPMFEDL